jgi:hypothetical protein
MECKCGGVTVDRQVVRKKKVAGEHAVCTACGRISWRWRTKELEDELCQKEKG